MQVLLANDDDNDMASCRALGAAATVLQARASCIESAESSVFGFCASSCCDAMWCFFNSRTAAAAKYQQIPSKRLIIFGRGRKQASYARSKRVLVGEGFLIVAVAVILMGTQKPRWASSSKLLKATEWMSVNMKPFTKWRAAK